MPDLSDELDKKEFAEFHKDFSELIRVTIGIDMAFKMLDPTINSYEDEYKKLLRIFMKKYSGLALKHETRNGALKLRIFLKTEKDIKEIFLKAASKISGIKSVGLNSFDEAQVSDASKVTKVINGIKDKLYITYSDTEYETFALFLIENKIEKKIEIVCDLKTASDKFRPEFKLIAFYALKSGMKKNIEFFSKAAAIGFVRVFTDEERNKWTEDFNPKLNDFG